jgi:hypothetical protein
VILAETVLDRNLAVDARTPPAMGAITCRRPLDDHLGALSARQAVEGKGPFINK